MKHAGWTVGLWVLALLLGLGSQLLVPAAKAVDPWLAVVLTNDGERVRYRQEAENVDALAMNEGRRVERRTTPLLDPWGRPLVWRPRIPDRYEASRYVPPTPYLLYSVGPDGVDDDGAGDDLDAARSWGHPAYRYLPARWLGDARALLLCAVVFLVAFAAITKRWARAPRAPSLLTELARALAISAWPASWGVFWANGMRSAGSVLDAAPYVVVRSPYVVAASWAALWILAAFAWRISRPRPHAPDAPPDVDTLATRPGD